MMRLVVVADDLGLDEGIDAGILDTLDHGIVGDVSLCAVGRTFDGAAAAMRERRQTVGVHLTAVEEVPLTDCPTVAPGGTFRRDWKRVALASFPGRLSRTELMREWRAQIERVRAAGLDVIHLNSHQHIHLLPGLFPLVVVLAREFNIPWVRTVRDVGGRSPFQRRVPIRILAALSARASNRIAREPIMTADRTLGVEEAGHLDDVVLRRLMRERVGGTVELITHPGSGSPTSYAHWNYDWSNERDALIAAGAPDGVHLTSIAQLIRERR